MPDTREKCPIGSHDWKHVSDVTEQSFGVTFGSWDVCRRCGWRRYNDFARDILDGSDFKIYPPEDGTGHAPKESEHAK